MTNLPLKGNVLVVGNSGVGKSTLINAVLGEYHAETGWGISGTTKGIKTYENDSVPFRLIDTAGFEPSRILISKMVRNIQKDCKERAKDGVSDTNINAIWFCVDGVAAKLFQDTIKNLLNATSVWKSIPIIAVITKSYSAPDREKNIKMVEDAFKAIKKNERMPRRIIPVVAESFYITEEAFAAPYGITDLVKATNDLLPEGQKAAEDDVAAVILERKRVLAQSVTGSATVAAAAVGAIPFPFPDALILTPIETGVIKAISSIYEIPNSDAYSEVVNMMISMGTVGAVAKTAINAIKAIPGIKIAASVLNSIIAGSIVLGLGEGCTLIFESVYRGEKTIDDINWIKNILENEVASKVLVAVNSAIEKINENTDAKDVKKILFAVIEELFTKKKDTPVKE